MRAGWVVVWVCLGLVGRCHMLTAQTELEVPASERALLGRVNAERTERGLPAMVWDEGLARAAREHARWMAARPGELRHQYAGEATLAVRAGAAGARFVAISENLAKGTELRAATVASLWMGSAVHRQSMLDGQMNAVGVGVVQMGEEVYVAADMANEPREMGVGEIEERVAAEVRRMGVEEVRTGDEARRACGGERVPGALVMGWDGTEPTRVPERVRLRVQREGFRRAEVGVCRTERMEAGFRTVRVAVVLR